MNRIVVLTGALAMVTDLSAQLPTPNEADIPKPVPIEMSLAGDPRPDISRFLNVRTAISPSLSPDGRRVAYRTTTSGSPQLWVVDATGGAPEQLTYGESVTFHEWSPTGDWIVYGSDRGGNEREGYYLISPDGTRERELLASSDAFREFGGFTRDGRYLTYGTTARNGRDFDIHVIDVATKEDRGVFRGRMGLYPVSWRPDGGAVILTEARGEDANDVYLLDVRSGSVETVFKPTIASHYASFEWTPDGRGIYLVTNQDREFAALAFFDLTTRALRVIDAPATDINEARLTSTGEYLAWVISEGGYSVLRVRHLPTGRDLQVPALPRGRFSIRWAMRQPVLAIAVSGPQIPGDIWTWNVNSGSLQRTTRSATAGLNIDAMIVPTHHSFRAQDGTMLHGLLYEPAALPTGTKAPVLLAVHGGPTAHAMPRFNAAHQYLLTRGIAIFDFNYRGSTGYGKTFARLNDRRLREHELQDLRDAVAWLRSRPQVDATRVAIMGGSYGGYLTMAALARLPEMFASGVAFVGVSNWITALEGASPQLKASDRIEYGDIDDAGDREFFKTISPITHVAHVRAPVMVIHGANDPRDPVTESDQFVRAIREKGGRVEYLRFPDEGHTIRRLPNQITAYRRIAAFLEQTMAVSRSSE
jgi:dipeptidyl aminopeptidase/acylaminoacyl peptidase